MRDFFIYAFFFRILYLQNSVHILKSRPLGESSLRYDKMERNLRRLKNKKVPRNPINAEDVAKIFADPKNREEFALNLRKTNNFYIDTIRTNSGEWFSLFASHQLINLVKEHIPPEDRKYLIDGTFKVRPLGNFSQLLVIHIEFKNDVSFDEKLKAILIIIHLVLYLGFSTFLCSYDRPKCRIVHVHF